MARRTVENINGFVTVSLVKTSLPFSVLITSHVYVFPFQARQPPKKSTALTQGRSKPAAALAATSGKKNVSAAQPRSRTVNTTSTIKTSQYCQPSLVLSTSFYSSNLPQTSSNLPSE